MLNTVLKQEAQLMLTNLRNAVISKARNCIWRDLETRNSAIADKPHDAFKGQSRSPNIVPFHMLGIVSSYEIVTLSLRRAVFKIFEFKKCRELEMGVKGHSRSLRVISFHRLCMVSY